MTPYSSGCAVAVKAICVSSLSTRGEEAECAVGGEWRVLAAAGRSPESPTGPTPKLRPDLVVVCCLLVSSVSSLMLRAYAALTLGANE